MNDYETFLLMLKGMEYEEEKKLGDWSLGGRQYKLRTIGEYNYIVLYSDSSDMTMDFRFHHITGRFQGHE